MLGRTQGELYYRHVWEGGLFPEKSLEFRERLYLDIGIPFQVQWLFGRDREGFGMEYSGTISQESRRWGLGFFWEYYLGPAPPPKPRPARASVRVDAPSHDPLGEELEMGEGLED